VVRETEVDGVPTLVAPIPGPLNAGLMFRVGRADETLSRTGITHLVEHLALFGHSLSDYHHNGSTGATITHFHMSGSESDVVDFLAGVCASLTDLPIARLEIEKEILRTEEHNRPSGANHSMPLWRYGSVGYGLLSYPEWGLYLGVSGSSSC
jgi:zinc protease